MSKYLAVNFLGNDVKLLQLDNSNASLQTIPSGIVFSLKQVLSFIV